MFHSESKTSLEEVLRLAGGKIQERLDELWGKRESLFVEEKLPFGNKYYPDSVYGEHTKYFVEKQQLENDGKKGPSKNASYAFRSSTNMTKKESERDEKPRWLSLNSTRDEVSRNEYISRSLRVSAEQRRLASKGGPNWISASNKAATDECKRLEHILAIIQSERLNDIERAKSLLRADGDKKQLAHLRNEVEKTRADRADWIMRILHDYGIISSTEMMVHLQSVEQEARYGNARLKGQMEGVLDVSASCSKDDSDDSKKFINDDSKDATIVARRRIIATPDMQERALRTVERRKLESREMLGAMYSGDAGIPPLPEIAALGLEEGRGQEHARVG